MASSSSPQANAAETMQSTSRRTTIFGNSSKYSAALANVKPVTSEESKTNLFEEFKTDLKKTLAHSPVGKFYENLILLASVLSTLEYIYETYLTYDPDNQMQYARRIELAFVSLFGLDWCLNLIIADQLFDYLFSFYSMVDMITVISVIATYHRTRWDYSEIHNVIDVIYYILFGCKTVRVLRAVWFSKKLILIEDAVQRYLGEISLAICVMILFFSAVMQYLESETLPYSFHTWTYYIWVTISTVGYGDITPQTTLGRIAAMAIILIAIISIPKMTNELIEKMSLQSVYMRAIYSPKSTNSKHILICGDLSSTSLNEFFEELYHEDHENTDLKAVILLPMPPTIELLLLMRDPNYSMSLTYLEGSALTETGLKRAKAESAQAIFIMTNKFSPNPDEEDAKSILLNLSIKNYLSNFIRRDIMFCMQLLRPQNKRHLQREEFAEGGDNELTVCLNEIKLGVMAKAVMYPGCNTLVMNLISSFSDDDLNIHDYVSPGSPSNEWLQEYLTGAGWEIYTTTLSDAFIGLKFSELSYALYEKLGVVLFALQLTDRENGGYSKVLLNPSSFIIPSSDEYTVEAFVIAENQASSDLSFAHPNKKFSGLSSLTKAIKATVVNPNNNATANANAGDGKSTHSQPSSSSKGGDFGTDGAAAAAVATAPKSKWDLIKKSNKLLNCIESSNYEEIYHKLENEHFVRNYYLRPYPVEISEVIIKTEVITEIPHINNHLIVLGKGLRNLYDLIKPLRAKYIGALRHIVILYPYDIPHDVWQQISLFDAVVIVRGSPLEDSNLRRAGIFRAAQVVVLAEGSSDSVTANLDALVDSDAIFAYQHVKRMNPNTQVVIEVVHKSSISYLHTDKDSKNANYKFTPLYASGTLFTTSSLDSIICQTYYNPQVLKVVNLLLSGIDQVTGADIGIEATKQYLLATESNAADMQRTASVRASTKSARSLEAIKTTFDKERVRSGLLNIEGSCLYQIPVPEQLEQKTYGALFKYLVKDGIIPLGLLRGTFSNMSIGPKENTLPYVYTNPGKNTEVFSCDRVFVLSVKPLQVMKMDMKNWVKEIVSTQPKAKDPISAILLEQQKKEIAAGVSEHSNNHNNNVSTGIDQALFEKKLSGAIEKINQEFTSKLSDAVDIIKTQLSEQMKSMQEANKEMLAAAAASAANSRSQGRQGQEAIYSEDSDHEDSRMLSRVSPAPVDYYIYEESKNLDDSSLNDTMNSGVRSKPQRKGIPKPANQSTPDKKNLNLIGPSTELLSSFGRQRLARAGTSPIRQRSNLRGFGDNNTVQGDDDNGSITSIGTANTTPPISTTTNVPTIIGPSISMLKYSSKK